MPKAKIVFLDRDGTINFDAGYTADPAELELLDGAGEAIALLHRSGFVLVVISNQSAVGRGMVTSEQVEGFNAALQSALLKENGEAVIDGVYFCPHHPNDNCSCRKPRPGLLQRVSARWEFDVGECWMIGDKCSDIEFGLNAGFPVAHCLLVRTGSGRTEELFLPPSTLRFDDLRGAAEYIVNSAGR